ncbi:MAG: tyrosine-type recombinase/integrase [Terriglobales bacterium]
MLPSDSSHGLANSWFGAVRHDFSSRLSLPVIFGPDWFREAVKKASIKDFTWHCLGHTFASRLIMAGMAGVDLKTVQELMGHLSITMTAVRASLARASCCSARKTPSAKCHHNCHRARKCLAGGSYVQ